MGPWLVPKAIWKLILEHARPNKRNKNLMIMMKRTVEGIETISYSAWFRSVSCKLVVLLGENNINLGKPANAPTKSCILPLCKTLFSGDLH